MRRFKHLSKTDRLRMEAHLRDKKTPNFAQNGSRRELVVSDPAFDILGQLVILAELYVRTFRREVGAVFHFAEV